MSNIGLKVAMLAGLAAFALTTIPTDASAARQRTEYQIKREACRARASRMGFGVHWIKRNRWITACIAGRHPV